jgi:hypothetical protein
LLAFTIAGISSSISSMTMGSCSISGPGKVSGHQQGKSLQEH